MIVGTMLSTIWPIAAKIRCWELMEWVLLSNLPNLHFLDFLSNPTARRNGNICHLSQTVRFKIKMGRDI
jgi:hypothetical protein